MENQLECPHCRGFRVTTKFSFLNAKTGKHYIGQHTYSFFKLAYLVSIGFMILIGYMALSGQSPDAWVIFPMSIVFFFISVNVKGNVGKSRIRLTHKCGYCGYIWDKEFDHHKRNPTLALSGNYR